MSTNPDEIPCPWCGRTNDRHFAIDEPDAAPSDLDVSLCMTCGLFSLFCVHPDGIVHLTKPESGLAYAHIANVLEGADT